MGRQKPDIEPGVYRLTQEVENPKPDGRMRNDWRYQKTFKPGLFVLSVHNLGFEDTPAWVIALKPLTGPRRWATEVREHTEAILPHLVREKTLASSLLYAEREYYIDMRQVLLRLVRNGVVSDPEVRLAVTEEMLELDKEEDNDEQNS